MFRWPQSVILNTICFSLWIFQWCVSSLCSHTFSLRCLSLLLALKSYFTRFVFPDTTNRRGVGSRWKDNLKESIFASSALCWMNRVNYLNEKCGCVTCYLSPLLRPVGIFPRHLMEILGWFVAHVDPKRRDIWTSPKNMWPAESSLEPPQQWC